jgi:transcriptional regulator with XRE-family HTH domain
MTIYQLAKSANLDRTTIQRSISGERLPNINFVEKLCDYLYVSPLERKELTELYSISKIGEKIYFRRKYVKVLLEQIAALRVIKNRDTNYHKTIINNNITHEIKVFSGQYNVNKIILDVLEDEALNTDVPLYQSDGSF